MIDRTLIGLIQEAMLNKIKYYATYIGEVVDNKDSEKLGRVKIIIPRLDELVKDLEHAELIKALAKVMDLVASNKLEIWSLVYIILLF